MTALPQYSWPEAIGAFLVAGVATSLIGVTGLLGRLVARVPREIAAMLAGILFPFATAGFTAAGAAPGIVLPVLGVYFALRRTSPRWAVLGGLSAGLVATALLGRFGVVASGAWLTAPVFTMPSVSIQALVGLAVPLIVVTAASQNAPGIAVLRASGYQPDDRLLVTATGGASGVLAPFGSPGINVAAITAAICTGREAHEDPSRRYVAGVACGLAYTLIGLVGGGLVAVFTALPQALVAAVASGTSVA